MIQDTTLKSFQQNIPPQKGHLEYRIKQLLTAYRDGLTNKEIAQFTGKDASTISGIMRPMVVNKIAYEAGERACRVTGNRAKVWRLRDLPPLPAPQPQTLFPNSPKVANETNTWH